MKKLKWLYVVIPIVCILAVAGVITLYSLANPICTEKGIYYYMNNKTIEMIKGEPESDKYYDEFLQRLLVYNEKFCDEQAKVTYIFKPKKLFTVVYDFKDLSYSRAKEITFNLMFKFAGKYDLRLYDMDFSSDNHFYISADAYKNNHNFYFDAEYVEEKLEVTVDTMG